MRRVSPDVHGGGAEAPGRDRRAGGHGYQDGEDLTKALRQSR